MKKIFILSLLTLFIVPAVSFASLNVNMMYGSEGAQVSELQDFLISKGFLNILQPTGYFYSLTRNAVISYQESVALPNTGYVGPLTRAQINSEIASANQGATSEALIETGTTTPAIDTTTATSTPTNIVTVSPDVVTPQTSSPVQVQAPIIYTAPVSQAPVLPAPPTCSLDASWVQQAYQAGVYQGTQAFLAPKYDSKLNATINGKNALLPSTVYPIISATTTYTMVVTDSYNQTGTCSVTLAPLPIPQP